MPLGRLAQRGTRDIDIVGSSWGTPANEPAESSHQDEGDDCVDGGDIAGADESDNKSEELFGKILRLGQHGVLHYQCDDSCTLYRGQGYIQVPGMR